MSITGIVGLKPGYEEAIKQAPGAHLQLQFMLKKEDGSIKPDNKAYIFRNDKENLSNDNNVYPVNGELLVPNNTLGFIMFGIQSEHKDYNEILSLMKGFNPNQPPTGIEHGAVHCSEIIAPEFFTFAVLLNGSLFMNGVESRYHHLYDSINFDLSEDQTNIKIKSIHLTESLYKITDPTEKYNKYLARAFIENDK